MFIHVGTHGQELAHALTWLDDPSLGLKAMKLNFPDASVVPNGQALFKCSATVMWLHEFYPGCRFCLSISKGGFACLSVLVWCLTKERMVKLGVTLRLAVLSQCRPTLHPRGSPVLLLSIAQLQKPQV